MTKQFCTAVGMSGVLGFGSNVIDITCERQGYVPPFQKYSDSMGYYLNQRVAREIGTNDLKKLDLYKGENLISHFLRGQQLESLEKRAELNKLYENQQRGQEMLEASKRARQESDENSK